METAGQFGYTPGASSAYFPYRWIRPTSELCPAKWREFQFETPFAHVNIRANHVDL